MTLKLAESDRRSCGVAEAAASVAGDQVSLVGPDTS